MEENRIFVQDEEGNEIEYEVVLTFEHPDTKKKYVVYKELGDTEEVMAAVYDESSETGGSLKEIETDEEFEMIQNVLDAFMDDESE